MARSLAGVGSHIYPGNAVTERKYCGFAAATWNAAMPPFEGPAMWKAVDDGFVAKDVLQAAFDIVAEPDAKDMRADGRSA